MKSAYHVLLGPISSLKDLINVLAIAFLAYRRHNGLAGTGVVAVTHGVSGRGDQWPAWAKIDGVVRATWGWTAWGWTAWVRAAWNERAARATAWVRATWGVRAARAAWVVRTEWISPRVEGAIGGRIIVT